MVVIEMPSSLLFGLVAELEVRQKGTGMFDVARLQRFLQRFQEFTTVSTEFPDIPRHGNTVEYGTPMQSMGVIAHRHNAAPPRYFIRLALQTGPFMIDNVSRQF